MNRKLKKSKMSQINKKRLLNSNSYSLINSIDSIMKYKIQHESMETIPWVEKYRPRKLEEMTQEKELLDLFKNNIRTGNMTHYLFHGPPGTGKTSAILAIGREIFREHFPSRVIEFNASDDRGINAVRDKITKEAKKSVSEIICEDGTVIPAYKIIILDEADSMTDEAQDALRVIIEEYSSVTRFCFICNYIVKITQAIKSRCSTVYFKQLSKECMISKLNEIAIKETMKLSPQILDIIIEVSNGDMRKAIMLLQNLKFLYSYKKSMTVPLFNMSPKELKLIFFPVTEKNINTEIIESDIYEIAAFISVNKAHKIIDDVLTKKNIIEISNFAKEIIAMGYPIDNVLLQLNRAVLETKKFNDIEKSIIIKYSGGIFLKMKESANEYIQLLDYLSCIYGVKNSIGSYH